MRRDCLAQKESTSNIDIGAREQESSLLWAALKAIPSLIHYAWDGEWAASLHRSGVEFLHAVLESEHANVQAPNG